MSPFPRRPWCALRNGDIQNTPPTTVHVAPTILAAGYSERPLWKPRFTTLPCRPVRWLVHGKLTPAVAEALKRHGDAAQDLSSLSLAPGTSPAEVLKVAQKAQ